MEKYRVVENFISINGEGTRAGQLALFIRFQQCNLACSYCDTRWANGTDAPYEEMTLEEIVQLVKKSGVTNVTLTGGEPLLREGMTALLSALSKIEDLHIEIETNGSVDLTPYAQIAPNIYFTMDYKLPSSGMEGQMCTKNFELLQPKDTVKFVSGSLEDLERARQITERYRLDTRVHVYLSPVFGRIDPKTMVAYMIEHRMNHVNLQLQLHKFIWDPDEKGV